MPSNPKSSADAMEIDRLAMQLAKDPQSKVFLPLAEEYCKSGMWREAASVLEDGLRYYPGFITAMVVLGRAYDQLGQPTKAKAVLEEAVKLSPDNLRAHRILIKIYVSQGQIVEALKSCDVILNLNPRDEEARLVQAKLGRASTDTSASTPTGPTKRHPSTGQTATDASRRQAVLPSEPAQMTVDPRDTETQEPSSLPPHESPVAAGEPESPHAELIARLESWLRSLERERRDRRDEESDSSTSR